MILVTVNSVFMYTRHFCNVINNYLSAFYCQTRHECVQSTTNKSALEWYCKHALLNLLRTRGHYNRDIRKIGFRYFGFLTRPQGETNIVYFQLRSLTQFPPFSTKATFPYSLILYASHGILIEHFARALFLIFPQL